MFVKSTRFKQVCQLLLSLIVAFSLFQTPLNISGDVVLREHLVFSALVSSFSRQEKPEEL